jgi:hypothetical protein
MGFCKQIVASLLIQSQAVNLAALTNSPSLAYSASVKDKLWLPVKIYRITLGADAFAWAKLLISATVASIKSRSQMHHYCLSVG